MFTFVVDMMGSDLGASELAKGVLKFVTAENDVHLICVGRKEELSLLLNNEHIEIIDAPDVVPMECGAMQLLRLKQSSMVMALNLLRDNNLDGIISAGSTGGFLTGATLIIKNISGLDRAALTTPFPTAIKGKKVTILDIGASNSNTPDHLVSFAKMGRIYSKYVLDIKEPRTYLLSNGTEEGKGSPVSKDAYKILKDINFKGFMGNAEARDILDGNKDVIVAEGFAGNVLLKSTEGTAMMVSQLVKKAFGRNIFSKIGYLLCRKGIKEMKSTMDYKTTGGAILLGVNKVVVKAHGSSDARAFFYALKVANKMASIDIVEKLKEEIK